MLLHKRLVQFESKNALFQADQLRYLRYLASRLYYGICFSLYSPQGTGLLGGVLPKNSA